MLHCCDVGISDGQTGLPKFRPGTTVNTEIAHFTPPAKNIMPMHDMASSRISSCSRAGENSVEGMSTVGLPPRGRACGVIRQGSHTAVPSADLRSLATAYLELSYLLRRLDHQTMLRTAGLINVPSTDPH